MRFDSAEVSSDLSLARSVTMKRFETSAAWPIRSSVAGNMSCIQMPRGPHQREVQHQQPGKHAARDRQRRACLEPRQQHDEIGGDERNDEQFCRNAQGARRRNAPAESTIPRAPGQRRAGSRRDRRHLVGADAGGGGADEHDLVGVLGGRILPLYTS